MASIQILTPEELVARDQKPNRARSGRRRSPERTRIVEEYKTVLQPASPGFGGDVTLGADEDKRLVRQNLKTAAEELGKALEFRPIKDKSRIHFRVITREQQAAKPKRGGRPRKGPPEARANVVPEVLPAAPQAVRRSRPRRQPQEG